MTAPLMEATKKIIATYDPFFSWVGVTFLVAVAIGLLLATLRLGWTLWCYGYWRK